MHDARHTPTQIPGSQFIDHAAVAIIEKPVPLVIRTDETHRRTIRNGEDGDVLAVSPLESDAKRPRGLICVEYRKPAPCFKKRWVGTGRRLPARGLREKVANCWRIGGYQPIERACQIPLLSAPEWSSRDGLAGGGELLMLT